MESLPFDVETELRRHGAPLRRLAFALVHDAASVDELGPVAAAATIARLARLPQCVELVASALLVPLRCAALPRPAVVIWGHAGRPARWLPQARAVLHIDGELVRHARLGEGDVERLDGPFGYPVGRLVAPARLRWAFTPRRIHSSSWASFLSAAARWRSSASRRSARRMRNTS